MLSQPTLEAMTMMVNQLSMNRRTTAALSFVGRDGEFFGQVASLVL
jgi:hypothetical protein